MFGWLDRLSLLSGPLPVVLAVCGIAGAGWLLASRRRWFLRWALPAAVVGAVAATLLLWVIVEKVWKPFPDPIETSVYVWIGIGLWAALLALPRAFTTRKWWCRSRCSRRGPSCSRSPCRSTWCSTPIPRWGPHWGCRTRTGSTSPRYLRRRTPSSP